MSRKKKFEESIRDRLAYLRKMIPEVRKLRASNDEWQRSNGESLLKMILLEHDKIREEIRFLKALEKLTPLQIIESKRIKKAELSKDRIVKQLYLFLKDKRKEINSQNLTDEKRELISDFIKEYDKRVAYLHLMISLGDFSELNIWFEDFSEFLRDYNIEEHFKKNPLFNNFLDFISDIL